MCAESYGGAPAQSLSGGNPEAETTHGLVTSLHKVRIGEMQFWLHGRYGRKERKNYLSRLPPSVNQGSETSPI